MNCNGAVIDGDYRYRLWREVAPLTGRGTCVFVMLNPSTAIADASKDDPTMGRVKNFAAALGFARVEVVNLFAYRATKPMWLRRPLDPVGPEADRHIDEALACADLVIAGWGGLAGLRSKLPKTSPHPLRLTRARLDARRDAVLARLEAPQCFGETLDGQPRHPLYLPNNTALRPYPTAKENRHE